MMDWGRIELQQKGHKLLRNAPIDIIDGNMTVVQALLIAKDTKLKLIDVLGYVGRFFTSENSKTPAFVRKQEPEFFAAMKEHYGWTTTKKIAYDCLANGMVASYSFYKNKLRLSDKQLLTYAADALRNDKHKMVRIADLFMRDADYAAEDTIPMLYKSGLFSYKEITEFCQSYTSREYYGNETVRNAAQRDVAQIVADLYGKDVDTVMIDTYGKPKPPRAPQKPRYRRG
jgi:hypothetical protein